MIKVVRKALKILEIVSAAGSRAVKLSEISEALSEKPSTCAGIVKTMAEAGYLQRDPVRGYRLGILSAALLHGDLYDRALLTAARDRLPPLAAERRLYLSLAVLRGQLRHSLLEVDAGGQMVMQFKPNRNLVQSATGLMLLAHAPRAELDALLELYTLPRRFQDAEAFVRFLYLVRAEGYVELFRPHDVLALAVPVSRDGQAVAALGAMLRPEDPGRQDIPEVLATLRRGAADMTRQMETEQA